LLLHCCLLQTFNKTDVSRHQFALDWMNDFETFAQGELPTCWVQPWQGMELQPPTPSIAFLLAGAVRLPQAQLSTSCSLPIAQQSTPLVPSEQHMS
jgi:hypothetical protein